MKALTSLVVALVAILMLSACGDSPMAPSQVPCAPAYHRLYASNGSFSCVPN